MFIIDLFRNYVNALVGRNQEFEKLLSAKDISAAREKMTSNISDVIDALKEYVTKEHLIMKREDKIIVDKKGKFLRKEPVWKLPIPYPVFINEIALVFLYGRPVKWTLLSEGTDDAFKAYQEFIKNTRFDSKIRQCKRLAGAETESALLFRTYRDDDGSPQCQLRVLARSKGDEIYTRFDQYENMVAFAWGYYVKEEKEGSEYHFDVYTKAATFRCIKKSLGWEVIQEINFVGKIPVIYFKQEKEWDGVEALIHREESIASRTADTNDYFADPIAIMAQDIIKNMPEKKEAAKLLITNDKEGVDKAAKYLTWDNAPQSKKDELDWLQTQILQKTFTPNITTDTLKSISQLSGKALRTVMMLADIKAAKRKESHDELLDRTASLITAIIGNVLDVSLHSQCENLKVGHEFQEPFGEDIADAINNITRAVDAGILSTESAVELNPLIKDAHRESERLKAEQQENMKLQQSIFDGGDDGGAASYEDNSEAEEEDDDEGKGNVKNKKKSQKKAEK